MLKYGKIKIYNQINVAILQNSRHFYTQMLIAKRNSKFLFSMIYAWTIGLVNNRNAGDLIHHHTQYEIAVMLRCNDMIPV